MILAVAGTTKGMADFSNPVCSARNELAWRDGEQGASLRLTATTVIVVAAPAYDIWARVGGFRKSRESARKNAMRFSTQVLFHQQFASRESPFFDTHMEAS
jgi:hypothetical protein